MTGITCNPDRKSCYWCVLIRWFLVIWHFFCTSIGGNKICSFFDYKLGVWLKAILERAKENHLRVLYLPISCHWPLSILLENIKKPAFLFSFEEYKQKSVAWNEWIYLRSMLLPYRNSLTDFYMMRTLFPTYILDNVPILYPLKHQKTPENQRFSGSIKWKQVNGFN